MRVATCGRYNHPYGRVGMSIEFDDSAGVVGAQDRAPCDVYLNVSRGLLQLRVVTRFSDTRLFWGGVDCIWGGWYQTQPHTRTMCCSCFQRCGS